MLKVPIKGGGRLDLCDIGLFHFLSVQGDGHKIPGLVKSMNFQRSTAKSIPNSRGLVTF